MAKNKLTKKQQVLNYLVEHKSITSWQAIEMFGATRLSAIIFQLNKDGYNTETILTKGVDRNGNDSHYGVYWLISTPETAAIKPSFETELETRPIGARTDKELKLIAKPIGTIGGIRKQIKDNVYTQQDIFI